MFIGSINELMLDAVNIYWPRNGIDLRIFT